MSSTNGSICCPQFSSSSVEWWNMMWPIRIRVSKFSTKCISREARILVLWKCIILAHFRDILNRSKSEFFHDLHANICDIKVHIEFMGASDKRISYSYTKLPYTEKLRIVFRRCWFYRRQRCNQLADIIVFVCCCFPSNDDGLNDGLDDHDQINPQMVIEGLWILIYLYRQFS